MQRCFIVEYYINNANRENALTLTTVKLITKSLVSGATVEIFTIKKYLLLILINGLRRNIVAFYSIISNYNDCSWSYSVKIKIRYAYQIQILKLASNNFCLFLSVPIEMFAKRA